MGAVSAGPVPELRHQPLLAAVREQVAQPADLCVLLAADGNGLVTALQQRPTPAMEPPGLLREIGVDVAAKAGELASVLGRHQGVPMVTEADEGVDIDIADRGGPGEDADEDLAQPRRGPEQEAALDGPRGDLDEWPVREEAEAAAHTATDGFGSRSLAWRTGQATGSGEDAHEDLS